MGFTLSRYALFLCVGIPLYYRHALANNLEHLDILNATPEKYATHFTGQVCLHMVSPQLNICQRYIALHPLALLIDYLITSYSVVIDLTGHGRCF